MKFRKIERDHTICAVVEDEGPVITDGQSALELLMAAKYEAGTANLVLAKEQIADRFFVLSSGLAGEVLQKLINYGGRIAIFGDYSHYTSKPLRDFIYESNKGRDVFFAGTEDEACDLLTR